jgi:peptidoglycan/LPS O-acetylase OafA/YrhL
MSDSPVIGRAEFRFEKVADRETLEPGAAAVTRSRDVARHVYRPEIDGLRAVAVLLVVAFHLGIAQVRGGFIGVDVFFVISGYLITQIIATELGADRFSLRQFYVRRIRRIFPALFAVLFASAIAVGFLQFPTETADFAKSLISTVFFSSNFYFLSKAEYFGGAADSMPLLHTWSLAVEEQFYLFFPLLLMAVRRMGKAAWSWMLPITLGVALVSFVISTVLVHVHQESAFYLIFSRTWELAAGSLLALGFLPALRHRLLAELIALGGLLLIIVAAYKFHRAISFPGPLALAPVLGAAAIIYATTAADTFVGRLLSLRPIVFIGLISYSLYLWHWPLIVFWQQFTGHKPMTVEIAVLFVVSVTLAFLSWRFVEQPFRREGGLVSRKPWLTATAGAAAASMIGLLYLGSGGWPERYSPSQVTTAAYLDYDDTPVYRRGTCFIDSHNQSASEFDKQTCATLVVNKPNVLLLGDSHAAHLWRAYADTYPEINLLQATISGCKPVVGSRGEGPCVELVTTMLDDFIPKAKLDAVILSARWIDSDVPSLLQTIERIRPYTKTVYVFGPIVTYDEGLPRLLAQSEARGPDITNRSRTKEVQRVDRDLAAAIPPEAARYLSIYEMLCPAGGQCTTRTADGIPVQWDYGHLTYEGGLYLASAMRTRGLFP